MFRYLFRIYLLAVLLFTAFRALALSVMWRHAEALPSDERFILLAKSLLMGLRFDTVISCYLLAVPVFALSMAYIITRPGKWLKMSIPFAVSLLFIPAFFICAADIPYFAQGFGRLNAWSVEWGDNTDFVMGMVVEEFRYWWPVIPFITFSSVFVFFAYKWRNLMDERPRISHLLLRIGFALVVMGLCFLGIRGRLALKSPIRTGTAYFSKHAFTNELGLNPVFTFTRSYLDKQRTENLPLTLMPDDEAMAYVQSYLGQKGPDHTSIARVHHNSDTLPKRNVILVIMESMSAAKTGYLGNTNLTPNLDSLSKLSLSYTSAYTAGIHTYNGIFSTLFSWPSIGMRHPMKTSNQMRYDGIAGALAPHGYKSLFFTTHDPQFDNVAGFLSANGFDQIISQPDYPASAILSTLGVPDDFMFSYSMDYLDKTKEPFFAAYMTASDHGPYIVPSYFKSASTDIKQAVVEYADWSIGQFLAEASKKPWFDNTLFVFVADHGAAMEYDTEMPLSYHHTPLLFYAPGFISPSTRATPALQIDVFPTIMDILGLSWTNNTFGLSLADAPESRIIGFSADVRSGVIHPLGYYLVLRPDGSYVVYKLKGGKAIGIAHDVSDEITSALLLHARALPQAADFLIRSGKTGLRQ